MMVKLLAAFGLAVIVWVGWSVARKMVEDPNWGRSL